ncbi:hypothetical protein KIN20_015895 [Parelaphostrongylus tenuis]|uniref:Uncharacterized protein n=1 Tax=Parelaphostrongylus tenuis TaxID=148309 RepID=A0AAD5QQD2_PARTN|nr:hypothetical protein KIN20_015895 [Parelaphostrongylus tenuis]
MTNLSRYAITLLPIKESLELIFEFYANRNCAAILLISLLFVTLPSIFIGLSAITSFRICKTVGPYYIVFLLCAGVCNGVVHVTLNKNIRTMETTRTNGTWQAFVNTAVRF